MKRKAVKCLVQPGDGVEALLKGIDAAKKSVEILIFRFDRREIEAALARAVSRGVVVHALTAFTNRGGDKTLRALEMRLLGAGVTVDRTADDLIRYHGKMMIIDRRELYVLAYNFTQLDIERSRSFGVITTNRKIVCEAVRLFEADCARQPYSPGHPAFLVSPLNSRKQLGDFISGAKKELLIYDPEVSDPEMVRLLQDRAKAGVEVKVFGKMAANAPNLTARKLPRIRLHARTIVRDGSQVFLGSQSLRTQELDGRREVGLILNDPGVVAKIARTFAHDWALPDKVAGEAVQPANDADTGDAMPASKVAKQIAKAVIRDMPQMVPEVAARLDLDAEEIMSAARQAVKEAVRGFVEEAMEQMQPEAK